MTMKVCETCTYTAIAGERFCKKCRRAFLRSINKYLQCVPYGYWMWPSGRQLSAMEDVRETRDGIDSVGDGRMHT